MESPRFLYLHGFASHRGSFKGVALAKHFEERGVELDRLDLRVPSFEHLRLSAMIAKVAEAIGGDRDRAVVMGSSLGALTASRVAERDARVCALVLLAPAFQIAPRWRARMEDAAWRAWESTGWLDVDDYLTRAKSRVDFEFIRDAERADPTPFPDVRVPTLIVHGVGDAVASVELAREFARGKRFVRLVEVDDGHELAASLDHIVAAVDSFLAPLFGGAEISSIAEVRS